jgi:hypothetical protein
VNVLQVFFEIFTFANAVIGEASLPNFFVLAEFDSECMRVAALDQLHGTFECHVVSRGKQQMNMLGHYHESMKLELSRTPVTIDRFKEETGILFHDEKSSPSPSRESYEICSRRRHQASRFHERTSAAGSRVLAKTKAARVELVPSPSK